MKLQHILVANRGEIALRIMRSARALGLRTTAIYSEADARAPHVAFADHALRVGPAPVGQSYLNIERIVQAAREVGADAVHPGYGLLSENARFAQACLDAGLCFVGPPPAAIELMGDKRRARIAMRERGVPCVPGYDGEDQSDATLQAQAERIGFPLMVKAAAGGGGRGMRRVAEPSGLQDALSRARSEAQKAFGDGRLILERAIDGARHVEVQVFADSHGHVVHLGERDCSLQRRFQKVIEESPSPAVDAALRARMGEVAVQACKTTAYVGAGTVELLLEPGGAFYFLEMNTRLQVEHPVTELVTGLDLVALQLKVADGEALPFTQADVALRGHAIEARLYAEDPARGFVPATGRVRLLQLPDEQLVRFDHMLAPELEIGSHYDAMLGKLVAYGQDREQARKKLARALDALRVLGVQTNQAFLRAMLEHPTFVQGDVRTDFLAQYEPPAQTAAPRIELACAALLFATRDGERPEFAGELAGFTNCVSLPAALVLEHGEQRSALALYSQGTRGSFSVELEGERIAAAIEQRGQHSIVVRIGEQRVHVDFVFAGPDLYLHTSASAGAFHCRDVTHAPSRARDAQGSGRALAPMDGSVIDVPVHAGERVKRGQTLVVVEAMKLELRVVADVDGVVQAVHVARGAQVKARQVLAEVAADASA